MEIMWMAAAVETDAAQKVLTLFSSPAAAVLYLLVTLVCALYLAGFFIWRWHKRSTLPPAGPAAVPTPAPAAPGAEMAQAQAKSTATTQRLPNTAQLRNISDEATLQMPRSERPAGPVAVPQGVGVSSILGTRAYQQDACNAVAEKGYFMGVLCDGMGGMEDGGRASRFCIEHFMEMVQPVIGKENESLCAYMRQVVMSLDNEVTAFANEEGERIESGTTLVAAVACEGRLYWTSAGDSRIYLFRCGQLTQLTTDHNYELQLQEQIARGEITPEQAAQQPRHDALISYVGMGDIGRVDASDRLTLQSGDVVLLCSDGICKVFNDEGIRQLLQMYYQMPAPEMAQQLTTVSWEQHRGSMDNTSVVILRV